MINYHEQINKVTQGHCTAVLL